MSVAVAMFTAGADAQQILWNNGSGGSWSLAKNWSPANVPDDFSEHARIELAGPFVVTLDASLNVGNLDVTGDGVALHILDGSLLYVQSRVQNDRTILVNPSAGERITALLVGGEDARLGGSGEVVLNTRVGGSFTASIGRPATDAILQHEAGHTIRGTGLIAARVANSGTVIADVPKRLLLLRAPVTNNGTILATNEARLGIEATSVVNGPEGRLVADGGELEFVFCSITGGTIESRNGGAARVYDATSSFTDVTILGPLTIANARAMVVRGAGITNNGVITVNQSGGTLETFLQFDVSGTLGGTGVVMLNARHGGFESATLKTFGGGTLILNGPDHTVRGRGRIMGFFTNAGGIAPGLTDSGAAQIHLTATWRCQSTSRIDIDIGGNEPGVSHDFLSTAGTANIDGTLNVTFVDGFVPAPGAVFDIITATRIAGTFQTVNLPEFPEFPVRPRIHYTQTAVRVLIPVCAADWNALDGHNSQDFFDFVADFFAGDADFNGDGETNSQDYFDYLGEFLEGC